MTSREAIASKKGVEKILHRKLVTHSGRLGLAELLAHLELAFLFFTGLVTHSEHIGLSELLAALLAHFGFSAVGWGYFYDTLSFDLAS
jgi:hypothetical protein